MKNQFRIQFLSVLLVAFTACTKNDNTASAIPDNTDNKTTISVDSANFLTDGLAEPISIVTRTLSDGTSADCYKLVVTGKPSDHSMGPWCPSNISDDASAGGIWLEKGEAYDVDGAFIQNLATFYNDDTWMMYDKATGEITKIKTEQECREAANPDVGAQYKNHCVECLPAYVTSLTQTYYIPVTPKEASSTISFGRGPRDPGPSVRGLAFNGVRFDAPAPVDDILGAYTLAPFDDAGGHINLAAGYHYHAATGVSKKIEQTDGHTAMIGYAIDGYGIYENTDDTDLDESRGHYDDTRGYHYHVDKAGNNNFINSLHGEYVR